MKILLTIIIGSTLIGCTPINIEGNWKVAGTSGESISMIGYGDLIFKLEYEVSFNEGKMRITSENDMFLEEYNYEYSKNQLTIIYSDFGIPVTVEQKDKNEIYLYGGGGGNSIEEQSKSYFLMVLKKK
tara:strand:- start:168614 stop:168997 length:384 start_codon:yes stop_codon:yes gene_type:complete